MATYYCYTCNDFDTRDFININHKCPDCGEYMTIITEAKDDELPLDR